MKADRTHGSRRKTSALKEGKAASARASPEMSAQAPRSCGRMGLKSTQPWERRNEFLNWNIIQSQYNTGFPQMGKTTHKLRTEQLN